MESRDCPATVMAFMHESGLPVDGALRRMGRSIHWEESLKLSFLLHTTERCPPKSGVPAKGRQYFRAASPKFYWREK